MMSATRQEMSPPIAAHSALCYFKPLHQHLTAALAQNAADLATYGLDAADATALA